MKKPVRRVTFFVMLIGALASLTFTIRAGRNNHSLILIMLFGIWVVTPFMGLVVAYILSNRWPATTRKVIYLLAIVLTLVSLLFYSGVWIPAHMKPAFVFLIFPLLSWIILAVVIPLTATRFKKQG